jgi:predicted protein tyrosine phosphatase
MKKLKVLCVCAVGFNRSKYLAKYLRRKGYSTRYGGVDYEGQYNSKPLRQEDVDWAEVIIIVRKRLRKIFIKKFRKWDDKKIIVIDVTDSKNMIPKELYHISLLGHEEFQKKWTRPQLRKSIKSYLPLKI